MQCVANRVRRVRLTRQACEETSFPHGSGRATLPAHYSGRYIVRHPLGIRTCAKESVLSEGARKSFDDITTASQLLYRFAAARDALEMAYEKMAPRIELPGVTARRGEKGRRAGLPRPIRILAIVTLVLFLFFLIQLLRGPVKIKLPGSDPLSEIDTSFKDPNLDGKVARSRLGRPSTGSVTDIRSRDGRTSRAAPPC